MENKLVAFITSNSFLNKRKGMPAYFFDNGTHNGYVVVPPENKYHAKNMNEWNDIAVHGGISFSEPVTYPDTWNGKKVREQFVGKRNLIFNDAEFITENTEVGDDWWIFGFDTAHFCDNKYNWDRQAVIEETLSMMEQLNRE